MARTRRVVTGTIWREVRETVLQLQKRSEELEKIFQRKGLQCAFNGARKMFILEIEGYKLLRKCGEQSSSKLRAFLQKANHLIRKYQRVR